jgi:hypothetical protein
MEFAMNIEKLMENLGENKEALLKKSIQCKSAEQLLALAKEYGLDLDQAGAEEIMASIQKKPGELSGDELDAVAGAKPGFGQVRCPVCGTVYCQIAPCPKCHPDGR